MSSKNGIIKYASAILDILAMLVAYVCANKIVFGYWRTGIRNLLNSYMNLYMIFLAGYFMVFLLFFAYDDLLQRNALQEVVAVLKLTALVILVVIFYLYVTRTIDQYDREQMWIFVCLELITVFLVRQWFKRYLTKSFHRSGANEKIMLITTSDCVDEVVRQIKQTRNWSFRISNIAVLDKDMTGEVIDKISVVATKDNLIQMISTEEIDSVFLHLPGDFAFPYTKFIDEVRGMGKHVHWNIEQYDAAMGTKRVQFLGRFAVVTWNTQTYRVRYMAAKRLGDIIAGLLGSILMALVWVLASIGYFLEGDGGHTFLSYVRVGKNGRRFYQRRFRSLKRDGSKMSVTGSILKGLGLTNLPMAWNVLWGDMSLVGSVSPSLPEFLSYSKNHRRCLLIKPGVINFWPAYFWRQVQGGHSTVEECETEYIDNWTLALDIKVVIRTVELFITNKSFRQSLHKLNLATYKEEQLLLRVLAENEEPLVVLNEASQEERLGKPVYRFIKRGFDIIVSSVSLILLSPLFLVLGLMVHWEDGESAFYKQIRIGQNGKKLYLYKFRTMKANVGDLENILTPEQLEQYKTEFKIENDPRVTRIGGFLRKSSLDELPQLLNILKGELTLVGPRPIVQDETLIYGEDLGHFLSVKPGLTGYWQAYARNHASYESGERQAMELYYVDHRSLWLDFKIICRTFGAVLRQDGAM